MFLVLCNAIMRTKEVRANKIILSRGIWWNDKWNKCHKPNKLTLDCMHKECMATIFISIHSKHNAPHDLHNFSCTSKKTSWILDKLHLG